MGIKTLQMGHKMIKKGRFIKGTAFCTKIYCRKQA
jgi:hypothetical protein